MIMPARNRRPFQFSLRTLFLAVTAFAIALAVWPFAKVMLFIAFGGVLMFAPWWLASLFRRIPILPSYLRRLGLVGVLLVLATALFYYGVGELLFLH